MKIIALLAALAVGRPAPAGSVYAPDIKMQLAIYHLSRPTRDVDALVRDLVRKRAPYLHVAKLQDTGVVAPVALIGHPTLAEYAPPDLTMIKYFGVGLSPKDAERVQHPQAVTALGFGAKRADALRVLRDAHVILHELAVATDGMIWDEESRQLFTPASWKSRRLDGWTGGLPKDLRPHVVIHSYQNGELVRSITLGMGKLGLPDIVVERHARDSTDQIGALINLVCRTLAQKGSLDRPGRLSVESDKKRGEVMLVEGRRDAGDPENRIWEIAFERGTEGQRALLAELFGSQERVSMAKTEDTEMNAARDRARARLPGVRERFRRSLKPGEELKVKAPFTTRDARVEWMWVEVTAWEKNKIRGVLLNDPYYVDNLKAGAVVTVDEKDLFDYMLTNADGGEEGNETSHILMRREAEKKAATGNK